MAYPERFQSEFADMHAAIGRLLNFEPLPKAKPDLLSVAKDLHDHSEGLIDLLLKATKGECEQLKPILHGLLERLTTLDDIMTEKLNADTGEPVAICAFCSEVMASDQ